MATKYRVIKVKGSQPEAFIVVGIDFDEHRIKTASATLSEAELRKQLSLVGATTEEVDTWVEQGRNYPG